MQLAAFYIQRAWRRSWLRQAKPSWAAGPGVKTLARNPWPLSRSSRKQRPNSEAASAALKHRFLDLLRRRYEGTTSGSTSYGTFEDFSAAVLQGMWRSHVRMRRARRIHGYQQFKLYNLAAFEIQRWWSNRKALMRNYRARVRERAQAAAILQHAKRCNSAAQRIQTAWFGLVNYRVYTHLRDTIGTFRRSGDPYLLLKAVLPREAVLLDPAMQVHVRFRLGGSHFPPSIYYKIFTHGAVVDVCAFAPRNYAVEKVEGPLPKKQGWYERMENNGWRPLIAKLAPRAERAIDEVERASTRKLVKHFHHSRLQRRQDVELRRRQRTMEWMRKLYGLAGAQSEELQLEDANQNATACAAGSPAGLGGAARNKIAPSALPKPPPGAPPEKRRLRQLVTMETFQETRTSSGASDRTEDAGSEGWPDRVVEDFPETEAMSDEMLLEWSKNLDFDSYMEGWTATATTNGSDGRLPISKAATMKLVANTSSRYAGAFKVEVL